MIKILAVDGHALAYRSYYAMNAQELTNKDGMPTGAVFGFFRNVLSMVKQIEPDNLIFVFDPPRKTFRSEIFPEYKSNRKETPDDLRFQIDEIQEIIRSLGYPLWVPEEEEADDALASLAEFVKGNKDKELYLATNDKDLFAVLDENIYMLRSGRRASEYTLAGKEYPVNKWGVTCYQMTDFLSLMGDSSDFIPGVKGVGEKSAAKLIAEFDTLEKIYDRLDDVKPASVKKKLENDRENAFLSKKLVQLRKNVKPPFHIEEIKVWDDEQYLKNISIFKEKELPSLYSDYEKLINRRPARVRNKKNEPKAVSENTDSEAKDGIKDGFLFGGFDQFDEKLNFYKDKTVIVKNQQQWETIENEIMNLHDKMICIDTETTSKMPMEASLIGISIAYYHENGKYSFEDKKCEENQSIRLVYIPLPFPLKRIPDIESKNDYSGVEDPEVFLKKIKPLLEDDGIKKIGQNIKYDALVLKNHGVSLNGIFSDTMILSYLKNPEKREHNLDDLAQKFLGVRTISYKQLTGTGKKAKPLIEIPMEQIAAYAAEDAGLTLRLYGHLVSVLDDARVKKVYEEIDLPFIQILNRMEENGFRLDIEYLNKIGVKYNKRIQSLEKEIFDHAGKDFNLNSPAQLAAVLYEDLQIPVVKKTSGGKPSTDAGVLEQLKGSHPIVDAMLEYRLLNKLMGTYIDPLPKYIHPSTGKIHSSFSSVIAATGRITSSEPNLQNIPVKEEEGRAIRKAFIPGDGCRLLVLDYSQIELRILAHYTADKNLVDAFNNDEDIHDRAAFLMYSRFFNAEKSRWSEDIIHPDLTPVIDYSILEKMKKTPEFSKKRGMAKILNFSIMYGVTEFGLSKSMKISREEARSLIQLYFDMFPGVKEYMNRAEKDAFEKGYSENYFGRRRNIPELDSKNHFKREAGRRLAINTPIQSTAADLLKIAMLKIQEFLEKNNHKTKMLLQVHDELIFDVPQNETEHILPAVKQIMETCVQFDVPLKVNGGYGENWEEAK